MAEARLAEVVRSRRSVGLPWSALATAGPAPRVAQSVQRVLGDHLPAAVAQPEEQRVVPPLEPREPPIEAERVTPEP